MYVVHIPKTSKTKYYLADCEGFRTVLRRIHAYRMFCLFEEWQNFLGQPDVSIYGLQQFISASVQIDRA